ncbi:flavin-containing monooxygenase FMO GS-OX5 [Phtheirospermum japonicum]|uniref:Flavin-containing monooxygenase n=1 Tax=Phtheirospermum japonicum TaxID=374723 RepID=A0A830DAE9_9LAMI|nr:flavin-containing monooxygenase FMO GS-OX5 [Phtheirospermum japonicum]
MGLQSSSRVRSIGLDPDREIVHSIYYSLRTNLPVQLMGFSDYPFAITKYDDSRIFPGHKEVLEFLNEFAREFGLVELIRFKNEVVRVERVDLRNDRWVVGSRGNEVSSNEVFDAIVVCNGHYHILCN